MGGRIAFVDYDLDNFHANKFLELLRGPLAGRGYEVGACRGMIEESSRAWAEKNAVAYCDSASELADRADVFMVLAPSNPEVHLELAREVLAPGKPTFIDKTFAPDLATAEQIFALADERRTPVMTSSALRYDRTLATHVETVGRENVLHMQAWGGGASFAEYAIHPTEMVVSVMGPEVERVARLGTERHSQLNLCFSRERTASVYVYTGGRCPYASVVTTSGETVYLKVDRATIFENLLARVFDFFDTGREVTDRREALAIRRILDLGERPEAREA